MLNWLIKDVIKETNSKKRLYAEDIVWQQKVYPFYIVVQNNFRYCIHHRLLNRQEILNFKYYLNKYIKQKKYANIHFANDVHEIFTKLKDTSISQKQMIKLNSYLEPTIELAYQTKPIAYIKHLAIIK